MRTKVSELPSFFQCAPLTAWSARNNRNRAGPSKKLAKILGEDVSTFGNPANLPPSLAPPVQIIPETPWYLKEDYDPQDIIFDDKGGVRAGTLKALVARLTPHGSTGERPPTP